MSAVINASINRDSKFWRRANLFGLTHWIALASDTGVSIENKTETEIEAIQKKVAETHADNSWLEFGADHADA